MRLEKNWNKSFCSFIAIVIIFLRLLHVIFHSTFMSLDLFEFSSFFRTIKYRSSKASTNHCKGSWWPFDLFGFEFYVRVVDLFIFFLYRLEEKEGKILKKDRIFLMSILNDNQLAYPISC